MDLSCAFIPAQGLVAKAPLQIEEKMPLGALALHNVDVLLYQSPVDWNVPGHRKHRNDATYSLNTNLSRIQLLPQTLPPSLRTLLPGKCDLMATADGLSSLRFEYWKYVNTSLVVPPTRDALRANAPPSAGRTVEPSQDGSGFLRAECCVIALRNVTFIRLEIAPHEASVSITFVSKDTCDIPLTVGETTWFLNRLRGVPFMYEMPVIDKTERQMHVFFNTLAFVRVQIDASTRDNPMHPNPQVDSTPAFPPRGLSTATLLTGRVEYFDLFSDKLIPKIAGYPLVPWRHEWCRLDFAWQVRPYNPGGIDYEVVRISFSPVVGTIQGFPTNRPWEMEVVFDEALRSYLKNSDRWIEVGDQWFNVSRSTFVTREGGDVELSNHPANGFARVAYETLLGNPHIGNALEILEFV